MHGREGIAIARESLDYREPFADLTADGGELDGAVELAEETVRDARLIRSRLRREQRRRAGEGPVGVIACPVCGEPFTPSRSDARYCSTTCRVRAHRSRGNG
jgi:hypothetical protein